MRHLKIFEKFESKKLSKVLEFISRSSKLKFLGDIKKMCADLNYPISELSDEKFEYMRFDEAFKLKDSGGKKNLKFWFNLEGEYIGTTKFTTPIVNTHVRLGSLKDYDVDKSIDYADGNRIEELPHLQKISISFSKDLRPKEILATIWRDDTRTRSRFYAIQNELRGDCPRNSTEWVKYGSLSWFLGGGDHGSIYKATKKQVDNTGDTDTGDTDTRSPEEFNIPCDIRLRSNGIKIKEFLKDADFALILDVNSVKNPSKKLLKTQQDRIDTKKNALVYKTEDQIKKENIEKYLYKLSNYSSSNLDQVRSIVLRLYGWNSPLYFVWFGHNDQDFQYIRSYIYAIIKTPANLKTYSSYISDLLKKGYKRSSEKYTLIQKNIKLCKERAKKENNQDMIKFLGLYDELNLTIKKFLMRGQMLTISDLDVVGGKIKMMRSLMRESLHRLSIETFLEHLAIDNSSCYDYVHADSYLIEGMENVISTLSNF